MIEMAKGKKRFILIAVVVALVLVGSLAGAAFAQTGGTGDSSGKTLLARVAAILGIDQQKVEDAFAQAQKEMRQEALDSYLQNLVDQGKISHEQADQYKQWWQSRPEISIPAPGGGFGRHGFPGGRGWGRGYCAPSEPAPGTTTPTPTPSASSASYY